jgi:hypothetical protein
VSFDATTITDIKPPIFENGELYLSWSSSAPAGTFFQVYVNRVLAWHGTSTACTLTETGQIHVDIGTVADGEENTDFSATFPPAPLNHALLSWEGGTYEDPSGADDVAGYHIYGEPSPGAGINYARPIGSVTAYDGGVYTDGYGLGGFGDGGFGKAANTYEWQSDALYVGVWHFAVKTYDSAGGESTARTCAADIRVPPRPPAVGAGGKRLTYTYDSATHTATLNWLASPDIA